MVTRILVVLAGVIALSGFGGCVSPPKPKEIAAADYGKAPTDDEGREIAKAWLDNNLKDRDSARIEWGSLHKSWLAQPYGKYWYGYRQEAAINAKNSYGGYIGKQPYYIFIKDGRGFTALSGPVWENGVQFGDVP